MLLQYAISLYLWLVSLRNAYKEFIFSNACYTAFQFAKTHTFCKHSLKICMFMHSVYITGSRIRLASVNHQMQPSKERMFYNKLLLRKLFLYLLSKLHFSKVAGLKLASMLKTEPSRGYSLKVFIFINTDVSLLRNC